MSARSFANTIDLDPFHEMGPAETFRTIISFQKTLITGPNVEMHFSKLCEGIAVPLVELPLHLPRHYDPGSCNQFSVENTVV
jgi:hypothetical protein